MPVMKHCITGLPMNSTANTYGTINTGAGYNTKVLTPASSPGWTVNALAGLYVEIRTTTVVLCTIASNTASTLTVNETGPANGTARYVLFNEAPPGDGDTLNLNSATLTMVATPFPASGTLAAILSQTTASTPAVSAGQLTASLLTEDYVINATTINAGAYKSGGMIYPSGATYSLTINANMVGGTGGSAAMNVASGVHVTLNGNATGGGSGSASPGVAVLSGGLFTLNGSIIDTATASGVQATAPFTWINTGRNHYHQKSDGTRYCPEPLDHQLLSTVVCGSTTGTYHGVATTDVRLNTAVGVSPAVGSLVAESHTSAQIVSSAGGDYHEPERSEVWNGAAFGATTGTKRASSITNCSTENILAGVSIDDVNGAAVEESHTASEVIVAAGGNVVLPPPVVVWDGADGYGPEGGTAGERTDCDPALATTEALYGDPNSQTQGELLTRTYA